MSVSRCGHRKPHNAFSSYCRQAQLHQGHDDYQSVARREQREQEKRRADQARDAERKTREEVSFLSTVLLQLMPF